MSVFLAEGLIFQTKLRRMFSWRPAAHCILFVGHLAVTNRGHNVRPDVWILVPLGDMPIHDSVWFLSTYAILTDKLGHIVIRLTYAA